MEIKKFVFYLCPSSYMHKYKAADSVTYGIAPSNTSRLEVAML